MSYSVDISQVYLIVSEINYLAVVLKKKNYFLNED